MSPHSIQMRRGFGPDDTPPIIAYWCPACSILVSQEKNPISCTECDGDMTIAPRKFQSKSLDTNQRRKDAP